MIKGVMVVSLVIVFLGIFLKYFNKKPWEKNKLKIFIYIICQVFKKFKGHYLVFSFK
jgi:predicted membrane channel-forming protein YqfA (hemolysin III family)